MEEKEEVESIHNKSLKIAQDLVDELYASSLNYVSKYGIEALPEKQSWLQKEQSQVLNKLEELQESINDKASYLCLRGIALNVVSEYDARAVECLTKAVKLEPKYYKAWNALGECYWKHKEVKCALDCFKGALKQNRNKESLRNMSMVLRQMASDAKERISNIEESVKLAKEALALDIKDGVSWCNAYLSQYFNGGQVVWMLRQCMVAYDKAAADPVSTSNPDLFFNRAVAHKYKESYDCAFVDFEMSAKLDPFWDDPKQEIDDLKTLVEKLQYYANEQGGLKPKKFKLMIKSLKDSDLGPYGGGSYKSPAGKQISLQSIKISHLNIGSNPQSVIYGRVVGIVETKAAVPYAFTLADQDGSCICVTVYNLASGRGILFNDTVAIPEPIVKEISFAHADKDFKFRSIRIDNPVVLVVNRRKVGLDRLGFSVLSVTNISE